MSVTQQDIPMSREAFYAWRKQQPRGRFERLNGYVVAMAPERLGHVRMKVSIALALREAILGADLPCEAFGDGATVPTGDNDFEPDALVTCGERLPGDLTAVLNPIVVVDVISPGSKSIDTGAKLAGYFAVVSVMHYLIIHPAQRLLIHHRRGAEPAIETRILTAGPLVLDPPGLTLDVGALYDGVL